MIALYELILSAVAYLLLILRAAGVSMDAAPRDALAPVFVNDNRQAAGRLEAGALTLNLRAGVGIWRPEGDEGPALEIEAFGADAGPLQAPSPLIRVPEGTEIVASIRNELSFPLRVHGLCERGGSPCIPIEVPPSNTREVRFKSGPAGTYHYWATTTGMPLPFRAAADTQLSGAFIVDAPNAGEDQDRVLVITEWTSVTRQQLVELAAADDPGAAFLRLNPKFTFLVNGLSWPSTERLTYRLGEDVRWRVLNLSTQRIRCTCTASTSRSTTWATACATRRSRPRRNGALSRISCSRVRRWR